MGLPARSDRPGLGEQYGVAVNASVLEIEPGRGGPLERICEMGYARIEMAIGDAQRQVEAELAPTLWRSAYGRDNDATIRAGRLFTDWLCLRPYFAEIELTEPGLVRRFADCVLDEWLTLRCGSCGGSSWQEISASGKRVRPSGRSRNAMKAICLACRGSGRPTPSPKMRMRVLGAERRKIPPAEYYAFWHRQFTGGFSALREIGSAPRNHLHAARKSV